MSSIVILTDLETGKELRIPVEAVAQRGDTKSDAIFPRPDMNYAMDALGQEWDSVKSGGIQGGTDITVCPDTISREADDDFTVKSASTGTISVREGARIIKGRISAARFFAMSGESLPGNVTSLIPIR